MFEQLQLTKSFQFAARVMLMGTIPMLILIITSFPIDHALAQAPPPGGEQPDFTVTVQTAPDGRATIESHTARLDSTYFSANGVLDGLTVSPVGLTLTEGYRSGAFTSGIINSPLAFTTDMAPLWKANLPAGTQMRLEFRLRLAGNSTWSDWIETPEAFYPVRDGLHSGNLVWVGGDAAGLQFRLTLYRQSAHVSPALTNLTLVFNDTSQGPTDAEIAGQMAEASVAAGDAVCPAPKPPVVSRTDWGTPDGQDSPRRPPTYQAVTHIIVHQTETPNHTQPYQDWAGWVRSVWNYHANVLGWGDVGYNYLIDPNGVIYEGRAGGDDVIGIHDRFNRGSMAIGLLGCYGNCDDPRLDAVEPGQAMLTSTEHLMAWKLEQKGIDPLSSAPYVGLNNIPVIAGGRDVVDTSSPGDNIYYKLPELRTSVADRVACMPATPTPTPMLELPVCQIRGITFDKAWYSIGDIINLTVRLADYTGQPLPGAQVTADVEKTPLSSQAAADFGLVDRAGEYTGSYSQTEMAGEYLFKIQASDPTGQQLFLPCFAQKSVLVAESALTPTPGAPTPTPVTPSPTPITPNPTPVTPSPTPITPSPTPITPTPIGPTPTPITPTPVTPTPVTPTPTPITPTPTGPMVVVEPQTSLKPICSSAESVTVEVKNVTNLMAVEVKVAYDPAIIAVIDADPGKDGVQVGLGSAFAGGFVAKNEVNTADGQILFAAALLGGDTVEGDADLIRIDWQPLKVGTTDLTLENVILIELGGQTIDHTRQQGTVEIIANCNSSVSGSVKLQGRRDYGGVMVTSDTGTQTQTGPDGSFSIAGGEILHFNFPGYLSAEANVRVDLELEQADGQSGFQPTQLGSITLLAGDVNGDELIDILDLVYMAGRYGSADALADLNADGTVDILDLVMAANNYDQQGPLTAWQ